MWNRSFNVIRDTIDYVNGIGNLPHDQYIIIYIRALRDIDYPGRGGGGGGG